MDIEEGLAIGLATARAETRAEVVAKLRDAALEWDLLAPGRASLRAFADALEADDGEG
jgi:hypothetical protein